MKQCDFPVRITMLHMRPLHHEHHSTKVCNDAFLNYATARIFLHKVGGGYIFVHRMLLEYFAALPQTSAEQQKCNTNG